jgi:hypothetical protein
MTTEAARLSIATIFLGGYYDNGRLLIVDCRASYEVCFA